MCGNYYLSKGMTTESKMADTKDSTATTARIEPSADEKYVDADCSALKSFATLGGTKPQKTRNTRIQATVHQNHAWRKGQNS
jgi:hypothetical protein